MLEHMKLSTRFFCLALAICPVFAASPLYGQCGGIGWTGDTTCVAGSVCTKLNDWYFQCLPGSTTPSPTSQPPITSPPPVTTTTNPPPTSTGFVKTSGTKFTLNGQRYTIVGANSYWVGLTGLSTANMNKAFADIAAAGGTTVRTWGFNEVTSQNGNWYQSWSGSTPTINTGATGLQNFDNVVAAAKANGIRLIVALTNNWADYGGMDVYVKQIADSANHDLFYTNSAVKTAFKNYIKTFVGRYVNEPTILAWELANEPRCRGSTGTTSGSCTPATITAWAKEISAYIKSLDSNHLVGLGDEGFYNQPGAPTYPYQGGEGIDFDANLAISTLDFGTFHSYPEHWGQSDNIQNWGTQWIADHAASQNLVGKPVIIEEFGVTSSQTTVYTAWFNQMVSSEIAGDLIWQAGSHLSTGDTHNDGYAIYPDSAVYPLLKSHAAAIKARG
ncbi:putative mannan endo-1,4-beta-mannosidase F [Hypsizygus marmoreus]|uniref:mannan endo-1,4-beta-mannosidase n=1 Tax=Hypsizygus marmoreus TaxID=39966 RepID=A0A369JDN5_HYPMA|nr:putative mannan endo-1,4-beta-mannosidase F [Hypsizygus marmoreus]